jgi:uncharacterized protein involved in outer membrane biogenesis
MGAKRKKVLMIAGVVAALIVIAAIVAAIVFDINSYRPRIESTASEATGLDVRISGKMGLSFFPFSVSANDIYVANKGDEIIFLKKLKLGVELIPLFSKQLKVTSCELVKPTITIVKDAEGKFNFENSGKKPTEAGLGAASSLKEFRLSQGVLAYLDKKTGIKIELHEISLVIKDIALDNTAGDISKNVSFTGSLVCKEVRRKNLKIDNVKCPIKAEKGIIYLIPLTMDIFGTKGEGDATIDRSEVDTEYKINLKVPELDFAKLEEAYDTNKVIGGKGDLYASLIMKMKGSRTLMSSVEGTFSLRGDNLVIYTMDLDKVLSSYESSQEFHLVDLGAFFIVGPLGPIVNTFALKAYRYGDVYYQTQRGQGTITQFISHWKIKDGVADATDCALATSHNRVALTGKLNLATGRYENVTVALLDDKGCANIKQSVSGPFESPTVSAVSAAESLAGQFTHFYRKAIRFFRGGKCEVFYNGAVRQP